MGSRRISKHELVVMFYNKIQDKSKENAMYQMLAKCSKTDINNLLDVFEEVVYDNLKSATNQESIIVPLFEGMTIESVYTPKTTKLNNLTGEMMIITSRIKPKATFTRTCISKLSQALTD